ncbi:hypothetical protein XELAEV_18009578mg [Xenopus laevis]|uniref:Uncharacterized protein n=1 Tax=Xenopus laevis TaxID=8355 RepID=A0A974DSY3_XENLA|nr:hypothetical protein XELAEV_18009578mg [Xenopus laevis]
MRSACPFSACSPFSSLSQPLLLRGERACSTKECEWGCLERVLQLSVTHVGKIKMAAPAELQHMLSRDFGRHNQEVRWKRRAGRGTSSVTIRDGGTGRQNRECPQLRS